MPPAAKRQRSATDEVIDLTGSTLPENGPYQPDAPTLPDTRMPVFQVQQMVSALDEASLRNLLTTIVTKDISGQAMYELTISYNEHLHDLEAIKARERARVIDFDHYSKSAWRSLNNTRGMSGSRQYEAAFEAASDVEECIKAISIQCKPECSYGTKLNALETLRKIAKSILLANDTLGSEVRKHLQYNPCLPEAIFDIADSMTVEERLGAGKNVQEAGKGSLIDKVSWVVSNWEGYCLEGVEILYAVVELLNYGEIEDEEDDDGEPGADDNEDQI